MKEMIKCLLLLAIIFLSCANQRDGKTPDMPPTDASISESNAAEPLIIGGKQYHSIYPRKAFTLGEIDDIENLVLDIDPLDTFSMDSLNGIEQLSEAKNLKKIYINGKNLDDVDLSPLEQFIDITELDIDLKGGKGVLPDFTLFKSLRRIGIRDMVFDDFYTQKIPSGLSGLTLSGKNLHKVDISAIETLHELTGLRIEGDITRLPDLTRLEKLRGITIEQAKLGSLEGIGAPNVRRISVSNGKEFDSLAPLNNLLYLEELEINGGGSKVYKIADMSNLPRLKHLELIMYRSKIDLSGIENLSALEKFLLGWSEPFNIEGIGRLDKLQQLYINLIQPEPSVEFLRNMPNLFYLSIDADGTRDRFPHETEAYQVLDVSPLASLKKLRRLSCTNFIIKNIAALDVLDALSIRDDETPGYIDLKKGRLYDDTEKSKHSLAFDWLSG